MTKKLKKPDTKTFLEHIQEFKDRIFFWLIFLIVFSVVGYFLYPTILDLLTRPLGKPLYYTSPVGGFEVVFNTSLFFGFTLSLPVLIYQMMKFVKPTLGEKKTFSITKLVISSSVLAIMGITMCYFLVLPPSLKFLGGFGGSELTALISTTDYFPFVFKYLVSFAIIFQMPVVMLAINKVSKLNVKKLLLNFRYVFLISFIASAILTPTPDPINQTIMASPILILYLISVGLIWLT